MIDQIMRSGWRCLSGDVRGRAVDGFEHAGIFLLGIRLAEGDADASQHGRSQVRENVSEQIAGHHLQFFRIEDEQAGQGVDMNALRLDGRILGP